MNSPLAVTLMALVCAGSVKIAGSSPAPPTTSSPPFPSAQPQTPQVSTSSPDNPASNQDQTAGAVSNPFAANTIEMSDSDRQFFQLGYALSRASFAYADLAKKTVGISKSESKLQQIDGLASLEPLAIQSRAAINARLNDALTSIQALRPSPSAMALIQRADEEYRKPVAVVGDAAALQDLNPAAGRTLAALDEFEKTSALPESDALHKWLNGPATSASGRVWYAEGLIAGVADVASREDMPELLPNVGEIATDLRGLRDWIVLRLPDRASPDQLALKTDLDAFLQNVGKPAMQKRTVSEAELARLGRISHRLVAQVIPETSPAGQASQVVPASRPPSSSSTQPDTSTPTVPVRSAGVDGAP